MKNCKRVIIASALLSLLTFTACSTKQEGNRTVIKEPGKSIIVIDNENTETKEPSISVEKIDRYGGMEITDWLDEETVVLAMENPELGKMSLLENSEFYPRSIYRYNLDSKEFDVLKAEKDMFLGGATLSPNKKHLLYYEYSIGDTAHYIMSMDEITQSPVTGNVLGIAMTAQWDYNNNIIGVSYAGGAYMADTGRNITQIEEIQEQLLTVKKTQDNIYYITIGDTLQLYMLDLITNEKKNLNVENADEIIPSPDGKQILITQWNGSKKKLLVADAGGSILRTIAEGTEVSGASWSPDQRRIAYQLKSVINGVDSSGLYLYDVSTGKSMQIAVNIGNSSLRIKWSPSSKKIAVAELDNRSFNSSVISFKVDSVETEENKGKDDDKTASETKDKAYVVAINTEKKTLALDRVEMIFSSDEERIKELNLTSENLITGFYIYNKDDNLEWLSYEDDLSIELLNETELREGSLEELKEFLFSNKILAELIVKDGKIVVIKEQYIP